MFCAELKNVNFALGATLRELPNCRSASCSLTSFEIPSHLGTIGASCFSQCDGLDSVAITLGSKLLPIEDMHSRTPG
jgi:hypothetical protein